MAITYTTNLNLAKPAHGDVDWHIPNNENWDILDEKVKEASTITGTEIDADKDWNNKNITNMGYIETTRVRPLASDDVRINSSVPLTVTVPDIYVSGTAKIYIMTESGSDGGGTGTDVSASLIINGVTVASGTAPAWSPPHMWEHTGIYPITGGDIIQFTRSYIYSPGGYAAKISCDDTPPIIYPSRVTW